MAKNRVDFARNALSNSYPPPLRRATPILSPSLAEGNSNSLPLPCGGGLRGWVDFANFVADSQNLNEVEIYMTKKGQEYRTIDKSRAGRIYAELKTHIAPPKRVIQVLGTNGKGSTGRFIAQILAQSGYKILHFTSPHIFSFNERFYANIEQSLGVVSDENLTKAHRFLQKFAFASECSYFEYATFLALFLAQGVDFAILEAGVGGELDSTSVVRRDLCVFSVIDCDHTDILGDCIEAIATTKLNAVFYPNKVPKMLLGAQKYEIVEQIAESIAKAHRVEIFALDSREYNNSPSLAEGNSNSLPLPNARGGLRGWVDSQNNSSAKFVNSDFTHPLTPSAREGGFLDCHDFAMQNLAMTIDSYLTRYNLAPFLAQNLALALKATQIFGINANLKTLPKLDLRGRFERIAPNITIDVGHNENAAFAIKQLLGDKKVILVYNSYFQKNISEILGILKDNILRVEILPVAGNPRIIKRDILEGILTNLKIKFCEFGGVESIKDLTQNYLVFGSFSVVEAFMRDFAKAKRI
ncbi:Mur ligase family protein [Helicobacter sp. 23-1044]